MNQTVTVSLSEKLDYYDPQVEVYDHNENFNTCTNLTNSFPTYEVYFGTERSTVFPQFLRYSYDGDLPLISIQPHSEAEIGIYYVYAEGTLNVLKEGKSVGSTSESDYEETTYSSTMQINVVDS